MKKLKDYRIIPIFPVMPVSDPQISPNGGRVLFTYRTINMEENKYDSHIWLLPFEGFFVLFGHRSLLLLRMNVCNLYI